MNVVVNTFYRDLHPGAALQAYALSRTIRNLGCEPEILAYARPLPGGGSQTLKQKVMAIATRATETAQQYADFRASYLRESKNVYRSYEEIVASPPQADAYVCGSDQIWNPGLLAGNRFDPAYFLQFGPPERLRISYAASFGGYQPASAEQQLLRNYLTNFNAISVREPAAQEMLSKLLGRNVSLTLDPTLLLDDYSELLQPSPDAGRYVLLYSLQNSPEIRQAARDVAAHYRLPIWSAGGPLFPWKVLGRRVEVRGPIQWVNLIHNAATVVTNSFHGLVFSLLLKKRVILAPLIGGVSSRNDRMVHLCNVLGVADSVMAKDVSAALRSDIGWTLVDAKLAEHRQSSLDFLRKALAIGMCKH